jgi:hypothetical protein
MRKLAYFQEETERLDGWSECLWTGLEDRNRARRREIENEAEELIAHKYDELNETSSLVHLFTIRWRLEP